jgi:hypothetical protein
LKGAYPVTVIEKHRWWKFHARETDKLFPRFACIERKVLPQESGLPSPHRKFYSRIFAGQRVQGSHVIDVSVRQHDAADRYANPLRSFADARRRPDNVERESVVFSR